MRCLALMITLILWTAIDVSESLPVFPGAVGFGSETKAGRGGQIIKVTNLNDSGSGSLRAAVEASGPRIVVFEVGGTIDLSSEINIRNPYLTIAGQSAPSPGIMLKGRGIFVSTHDVLIQHLRIRVGDQDGGRDALTLYGSSAYNIVVDHVSASWAIDEQLSTGGSARNISISNSIFSECLQTVSSYGLLIGRTSKNISMIGNLLASNDVRMPRIAGDVSAAIINNVMYNLGSSSAYSQIGSDDGPSLVSMAGNKFIKGPDTASPTAIKLLGDLVSGSKIYINDNSYSGTLYSNQASFDPRVTSAPVWPTGVTAKSSSIVESSVLGNVGARPLDRDSVDKRIVSEVASRTGGIIGSQSEVGGWPKLTATKSTFVIPNNPSGDDDGNGYTNIEEILYQMARQLEGEVQRSTYHGKAKTRP